MMVSPDFFLALSILPLEEPQPHLDISIARIKPQQINLYALIFQGFIRSISASMFICVLVLCGVTQIRRTQFSMLNLKISTWHFLFSEGLSCFLLTSWLSQWQLADESLCDFLIELELNRDDRTYRSHNKESWKVLTPLSWSCPKFPGKKLGSN